MPDGYNINMTNNPLWNIQSGNTDVGTNTVTIQNQPPVSTPSTNTVIPPSYSNFGLNSNPNFQLNPNYNTAITNNPTAVQPNLAQQTGAPTTGSGFNMSSFLTAASPWLGMASAGMGLLTGAMNKPKNINQDFSFDLSKSDYQTNPLLTQSIKNSFGLGKDFRNTYQDMINPSGSYNQRMFQNLRQSVGDMRQQTIGNMNAAMAARGVMGMGNVYDAVTNRQAGDQYAQGMQGIMNTSLGMAGQFGQMATGAYGQGGQFASGIDQRALANQQFNTQNQNTYNQYLKQSQYNQQVQNQNAQSSWRNNMSNNLFNLGGSFLGMNKTT
tara:strand:+ start:1121 stop:2095 length:975 start_codon:yes stop_codon:yes gene_type:complete